MISGVYSSKGIEEMKVMLLKDFYWQLSAPRSLPFAQHILALIYLYVDLDSQCGLIFDQGDLKLRPR